MRPQHISYNVCGHQIITIYYRTIIKLHHNHGLLEWWLTQICLVVFVPKPQPEHSVVTSWNWKLNLKNPKEMYAANIYSVEWVVTKWKKKKKNPNHLSFLKPNKNVNKIQFSNLSLNSPRCDQVMNVALRQALPKPMTPVTQRQSNHTSIYHLHDMAPPPPPREKPLPHPFLFPLRGRRAWSGGGLGWRCANGERVHSPTHPFPALSRSIIVERWRWEPQSLPTTTPAAPPSAAAKQPPASPVYPPIYTSIHTLSHSSIK